MCNGKGSKVVLLVQGHRMTTSTTFTHAPAPMPISVCRESGSTRFGSFALNNRFLPAIFKQGAGNVLLRLAGTRFI